MVDEGGRHKLLSDKVRREGVVTQFKCQLQISMKRFKESKGYS